MQKPPTVYIEAQRLFRRQKHGMDVVALELLKRLRKNSEIDMEVLVKSDKDECLDNGERMSVNILQSVFYPVWERFLLPGYTTQKNGILHCTGNTAPLWGKMPLLVTIHDLIFLEDNYLFKKDGGSLYQRFGNFYRRLVVPLVARKARHIITVSEYQRELIIRKLNIDPEKVTVIYNGADERFFEKARYSAVKEVIKKYGIGFPYIFFIANTEPRKNTTGVLKAFAQFCRQHPEYRHKLVIKGLSEEHLNKKIEDCGATDFAHRIHRVGYIDHIDLPMMYPGADVLWFPSFSEGFGLPIVEAMAGGTPVITSAASVMPEIAGDAALYVNPHKPAELVEQTIALFADKVLKSNLVSKGRERAMKFTWNDSASELIKLYKKMLLQVEVKEESYSSRLALMSPMLSKKNMVIYGTRLSLKALSLVLLQCLSLNSLKL